MIKQTTTQEQDYCHLGRDNYCPHLVFCNKTDHYSLAVSQINSKKFERKKADIKSSLNWRAKELEGITCVCIERVQDKACSSIMGIGK